MKKRLFQTMSITQKIKDGLYAEAYMQLERNGFEFSLENLQKEAPKLGAAEYYTFLMFCISQEETPQVHKTICEVLRFTEAFFAPVNDLIYWHVMQSVAMFPIDTEVPKWILQVYGNGSYKPFTKEEMKIFAQKILKSEPNNEYALKILG